MPIDFPNSPSSGETFTAGDKTWTYNGTAWILSIGSVAIANAAIDVSKLDGGTAINGYYLKVNTSVNSGIAWSSISEVINLTELGDVDIANVTSGQVLKYNGSAWINDSDEEGTTISTLNDIGDVVITGNATNQFLQYNGSSWVNETVVGGASISSGAPESPSAGQIWFDSDDGKTYVYYDSAWVEIGSNPQAVTVSDSAPASPIAGQIWYKSDTGATYIYYDSYWVEVGGVSTNIVLNTIDAKGDLLAGTADNTLSKLSVGVNGYVLAANSATATGLNWIEVSSNPLTSNAAAIFIMDVGA